MLLIKAASFHSYNVINALFWQAEHASPRPYKLTFISEPHFFTPTSVRARAISRKLTADFRQIDLTTQVVLLLQGRRIPRPKVIRFRCPAFRGLHVTRTAYCRVEQEPLQLGRGVLLLLLPAGDHPRACLRFAQSTA